LPCHEQKKIKVRKPGKKNQEKIRKRSGKDQERIRKGSEKDQEKIRKGSGKDQEKKLVKYQYSSLKMPFSPIFQRLEKWRQRPHSTLLWFLAGPQR
jgi:hypothetical protein